MLRKYFLLFSFLGIVFTCLLLCIRAVIGTYFPSVPAMRLKTNQGKEVSLLDLKGREMGVIIYYSCTPCQGHKQCTCENIAVQETLLKSKRYYPFIIYGDNTLEGTLDFTRDIPATVLLDPGRKFAGKFDIRYYAVILYRKDGKVLKIRQGIFLRNNSELEAHLDHDLK